MLTAHRVCTSLAIAAAGATVIAAAMLVPASPLPSPSGPSLPPVDALAASDDGVTIEARLEASRITSAAHDEDIVIDVHAAQAGGHVRPPLSLVVLIDHSGSMSGQPLADAQAAAIRLVDHLQPEDNFAIVGFSSSVEVVARMEAASDADKRSARAAILAMRDGGGTCTSCGLDRAVEELASAPTDIGGVRRIVLMSDGHANEGLWDTNELVALAGRIASNGASITTVGVGLDFDEVMMTKIAEVGRGNYYFVENTANLDAMFTRELGDLTETVASDVHIVLRDLPGAQALDAIGYPASRDGSSLVIPFADLRAGETRKVVVRVHVTPAYGSASHIVSEPEVRWSGVGARRGVRHAYTRLEASISDDAAAIAASVDHAAVQAVEDARQARALDEATAVYEKQGYQAAERVLIDHKAAVHRRAAAIGDVRAMDKLDAESGDAMQMLKSMPAAEATKAVRVKSYELAR